MNDTIAELLIRLTIIAGVVYAMFTVCSLIEHRPRYRVMCECGHRERAYSLTSAKWAGTEHMQVCKGKVVVSPVPAYEIAEAYAKVHEKA